METNYTFPFGRRVKLVEQQDRSPKKVFVLGVYASAVHAKWLSKTGEVKVTAMAVASEPYIFWRGENADAIINSINIPDDLGKLVPAAKNLNGPSGKALDDLFLSPMGISRGDAWLCDLVPHSCLNEKQEAALKREYEPLRASYGLPKVTLPPVPKVLATEQRRKEILTELQAANPETIVLLGDQPIKWFLSAYDDRWNTLGDFGESTDSYGKPREIKIEGNTYQVIGLVHPRQAAKLGAHSAKWSALHENWINQISKAK